MYAFLSRSNSPKADNFVAVVKEELMNNHGVNGFETVGINKSGLGGVSNVVNDSIAKHDLIVVCMTKVHEKSDETFLPTEANYIELKEAEKLGLPALIFAEKGVKPHSLISNQNLYIEFDGTREDIAFNRPLIAHILRDIAENKSKIKEQVDLHRNNNNIQINNNNTIKIDTTTVAIIIVVGLIVVVLGVAFFKKK